MNASVEYKAVEEKDRLEEVLLLQKIIWGEIDVCPLPLLIPIIHNGGVVLGAYLENKAVGFCFALASYKNGEAYLYSHMMGIHPDYRNFGIGKQLKLHQRLWALDYGYTKMKWTFDPLESRNAYLNLCKLGGTVQTYLVSYYGELDDKINRGLPADRFLLEWDLHSPRTNQALQKGMIEKQNWEGYSILLDGSQTRNHLRPVIKQKLGDQFGYLIAIPKSIHAIKQNELATAEEWRFALRDRFIEAFAHGYLLVGILQTEASVNYYVIEKKRKDN